MTTTWILDWHPVTTGDLRAMPWRLGARVAAAVMLYAEIGEGQVARALPNDPHRLWLRVPGAIALLYADETTRTLLVTRVFRVR